MYLDRIGALLNFDPYVTPMWPLPEIAELFGQDTQAKFFSKSFKDFKSTVKPWLPETITKH